MVSLYATLIVLLVSVVASPVAMANPKYASIVMDADTGKVLRARNANKRLHPASLTKVMTLMLLFDAMEKGRVRLSDRIYVSQHAADMVPSKLGLAPKSYIRVRDAIAALTVKSANDVAVAVAEHLGGSETNFARMMTFRAKQIGMNRTRFMNASGLHHRRQISTARDMAVMAQYVIKNYPQYYGYFSRTKFNYAGKTYRSHNRLQQTYPGMDGMKTGYVRASGFNLIASAKRDGRRVIAVVFGGKTSRSRNAHMALLLDDGFRKLPNVRYARSIIPSPEKKPEAIALASAYASVSPLAGGNQALVTSGQHSTKRERENVSLKTQVSNTLENKARQAWSIQVGAFKTKGQTMTAIHKAVKQLPTYYKKAAPKVVPLRGTRSNLYRARLVGYSAHDAYAACAYIKDCIAIAP